MARSWQQWQHSRWRPVVAQAVMWVILGGTVGVAALVSHRAVRGYELGAPVKHGQVWVAVPKGWAAKTATEWRAVTPQRVFTARAPGAGDRSAVLRGRTITVTQQMTVGGLTPQRYLAEWQDVRTPFQQFTVAGRDGVRSIALVPVSTGDGEAELAFELSGCTVLPSGLAVTVQVTGLGRPTPSDERLFNQIAEALRVVE